MNVSHMKLIYSIVIFVLCTSSSLASAQEYKWAVPTQEPDKSYITGIVADHNGNSYTLGVNRLKGDAVFSQTPVGNIFLTKRNAGGEVIWRRSFAGMAHPYDIALDSSGSVIMTGSFTDSLELDKKYYHQDIFSATFLTKCDASGNIIWSRVDSNTALGVSLGISTTSGADMSIYVCGMDGDITPFVAKYSSTGETIWKKGFQEVRTIDDVAVTPDGKVFITGTCNPTAVFDSIALPEIPEQTGYALFIAGLDANGKAQWLRSDAFGTFSFANTIAYHNGTIHRFRYSNAMFSENRLERYNEAGTLLSSHPIPYNMAPFEMVIQNTLTVDSKGRAYIVDVTRDTIIIYRSRSFITPDTMLVAVDTFTTLVSRGSIGQGLTSDGDDLFLGASFTDGSIDVGKFTVMNTNNSSKFESSTFVTQIEIEPSLAVGVKDEIQEIYLYPNPATTSISFLQNVTSSDIHVYDVLGKEVLHASISSHNTVDVSSLPSGPYTAVITDGKKTQTARFIIK